MNEKTNKRVTVICRVEASSCMLAKHFGQYLHLAKRVFPVFT